MTFTHRAIGTILAAALAFGVALPSVHAQAVVQGQDGRAMIQLDGGVFKMGDDGKDDDEGPAHSVLLDPFMIDQFEVRVYDFQQYVASTKREVPKHGAGVIPILNQIPLFYREGDLFQINKGSGEGVLTSGEFRDLIRRKNHEPERWVNGNPDSEPAYLSKPDAEFAVASESGWSMSPAADIWLFNVNPDYPMFKVTWNEALEYCRFYGKRLPTEAEWEFAARGGLEGKDFPWGNGDARSRAVYSEPDSRDNPEPVGSMEPNAFGMYDMAGNLWEWVADWYSDDYYHDVTKKGFHAANPYNGEKTGMKIIRGGSWRSTVDELRVSNRNRLQPENPRLEVGFRCAVSLEGAGN